MNYYRQERALFLDSTIEMNALCMNLQACKVTIFMTPCVILITYYTDIMQSLISVIRALFCFCDITELRRKYYCLKIEIFIV